MKKKDTTLSLAAKHPVTEQNLTKVEGSSYQHEALSVLTPPSNSKIAMMR